MLNTVNCFSQQLKPEKYHRYTNTLQLNHHGPNARPPAAGDVIFCVSHNALYFFWKLFIYPDYLNFLQEAIIRFCSIYFCLSYSLSIL